MSLRKDDDDNDLELELNPPDSLRYLRSYGVMPRQHRPNDTLYWLDYNPNKRQLKLNGFVVKQFQLGKPNDIYFDKLFKQKGWVKTIQIDKPNRTSQLIKTSGLPRALSNAIFDEGDNETTLVAHTVIRRSRAVDFGVREEEIQDYLVKCRDQHYSLLKAGKRK
jgi:hypothetical protein